MEVAESRYDQPGPTEDTTISTEDARAGDVGEGDYRSVRLRVAR